MSDWSEAVENFAKAAQRADMPSYDDLQTLLNLVVSASVRHGFCAFVPPSVEGEQWKCEFFASQPVGAGQNVQISERYYGDTLLDAAKTAQADLLSRFRWQGCVGEENVWSKEGE